MKPTINSHLLKYLSVACFLLLVVPSCKKHERCDHAEVCVKNTGQGEIRFGWGINMYVDTLSPGESTCYDAGEVDTDPQNSLKQIVYFHSDHGNYSIVVDKCHVLKELD